MAEYRDIPGFAGYRVGDDGSVWSCWRCRSQPGHGSRYVMVNDYRELRPAKAGRGYWKVNLGRGNQRLVHRLVLEAFVGLCPAGMDGCHRDGNKENNHLSNLRWDTLVGNMADAVRDGKIPRGETHWNTSLTPELVREIRSGWAWGLTLAHLARQYGVSESTIHRVVKGVSWAHVE